MAAYGLKGLLAYVVLDLAGVCLGCLFIDAYVDKKRRQRLVPVKHARSDRHTGVGQGYQAVFVHRDMPAFSEPFGRIAYAGLCHA